MKYHANGFDYNIEKLEGDWWAIYEFSFDLGKNVPLIQVKGLERANSWCSLREPAPWFVRKLIEE